MEFVSRSEKETFDIAFDIASETGHIQHQPACNHIAAVLSILPDN